MTTAHSTLRTIAGISDGTPLAAMLGQRAEILALSEASHDAVLKPTEAGGLSHDERSGIAVRMALLNGDDRLAEHYRALTDGVNEAIADPASKTGHTPRMSAMLRHVDLVTLSPRDATRADIEALKDAGVTEADIVRLSELVAFVNYQARVVATLRLLGRNA